MNHAANVITHPSAGRNDRIHGDEHLIEVRHFTEAQIVEASDSLIADEIDRPDMDSVIDVLLFEMGDQFRDFLKTEPMPDVDAATHREVLSMAKAANALLRRFNELMLPRVREEAIEKLEATHE